MIGPLLAMAALAATTGEVALADRDPAARPQLLIVGTPHFGNPGRDVNNVSIPDVLQPDRQAEIDAVVDRLAAFRPTRIAIEVDSSEQAAVDRLYADYRAGRYQLGPSETDQIAFRLAAKLGLERVDAVNWNEMPPGTEADWNYVTYAETSGRGPQLARLREIGRERTDAATRRSRCTDVAGWLRDANSADGRSASNRPYFDYAMMGDADRNPGAAWVGNWYARNLRIFANLVRLGSAPEERILVVYGAGHGFLLDQFARQSRAFVVHDTLDYLPQARRFGGPGCP